MSSRYSLPILAAAALACGAALGVVAGDATIDGMRADAVVTERLAGAYGVPVSKDPLAFEDAGPTLATYSTDEPQAEQSDWDRGYRWAGERNLRHASACAIDSWSFQRGCEAAVRETASYGEDY